MKKILILFLGSLLFFTSCVNLKPPLDETGAITDANNTTMPIEESTTPVENESTSLEPYETTTPEDTETTLPDDTGTTIPDSEITTDPSQKNPEAPPLEPTLYTAYFTGRKNNLLIYNPNGELVLPSFQFYSNQKIQEENIPDYKITIDGIEYVGKYESTELDFDNTVEKRRFYFCEENNIRFRIAPDSNTLKAFIVSSYEQDHSRVLTQEECKEIADAFIANNYLPHYPNIDLSEFVLTVTDSSTDNWAKYDYYEFEYCRGFNGYKTYEVLKVKVCVDGTVTSSSHTDDFSTLETMKINYELAEKVAYDLANHICEYVPKGEITGINVQTIRKLYDESYVMVYVFGVRQWDYDSYTNSSFYIYVPIGGPPPVEAES